MSDTEVTTVLRHLRESAGISLREAARIVGMSHQSTYAHYEDARRYKRSYIPPEIVEPLAAEFEKRGINPQPLWDLLGGQQKVAVQNGLADVGLTPWQPTPDQSRHARVITAITENSPDFATFIVRDRALELRGYLPGDFVVFDMSQKEADNDTIVCAQVRDWEAMRARTLLRVYNKPVLIAASTNPAFSTTYMVDDNVVSIEGTLVASYRWLL